MNGRKQKKIDMREREKRAKNERTKDKMKIKMKRTRNERNGGIKVKTGRKENMGRGVLSCRY